MPALRKKSIARLHAAVNAAAASGKPSVDTQNRLKAQLQDLDFIYLTSLSPHREYSFKHVLTQQAVYDTLLRARREALHERAGHAIEELWADRLEEVYELLAHHYARSRDADRAVEYLELANGKAIRLNALLEAKGFFIEAMRFLDALPPTRTNHERRVALVANP